MDLIGVLRTTPGGRITTPKYYQNSRFYDCKAYKNGVITLDTQYGQARGYIDVLKKSKAATAGYPPILEYDTTFDTTLGTDLINLATANNILVFQRKLMYSPNQGKFYFGVAVPINLAQIMAQNQYVPVMPEELAPTIPRSGADLFSK